MIDNRSNLAAYKRYAPVYDWLFDRVFKPGRQIIIERMQLAPGDVALEIGVGTGLSLDMYPRHGHIEAIDLSPDMLARARARQARLQCNNIRLRRMDAQQLAYADNCFSKVAAMYVASVVPDFPAVLEEMLRVTCSGGDIFLVNNFAKSEGSSGLLDRVYEPMSAFFGFRRDLQTSLITGHEGLEIVSVEKVNLFGYWTLIHARKR